MYLFHHVPAFVRALFLLTLHTSLFAQGPGGISANMKLWLKADAGLALTGTSVMQWNDFSGAGITGNFSPQTISPLPSQTAPRYSATAINFNPYVSFDGLNNSLTSTNTFLGSHVWAPNDNSIFQVIRYHGGGVWFKWEDTSLGTIRVGFEPNGTSIRGDFPCATPTSGVNRASTLNLLDQQPHGDVPDRCNQLNISHRWFGQWC